MKPILIKNLENKVVVHYWPAESAKSFGHIALETFGGEYQAFKNSTGIYASFFPPGKRLDINTCFNQKFLCRMAFEMPGYKFTDLRLEEISNSYYPKSPILIKNSMGQIRLYGKSNDCWKTTFVDAIIFSKLVFPENSRDIVQVDLSDEMYSELTKKNAHVSPGCQKDKSHFHTFDQDVRQVYRKPASVQITLYSLNTKAINDAFIKFCSSDPEWNVLGGSIIKHSGTQNCSGLVYDLLQIGGMKKFTEFNPLASIGGASGLNNLVVRSGLRVQLVQLTGPLLINAMMTSFFLGVLGMVIDAYQEKSTANITPKLIIEGLEKMPAEESEKYEIIDEEHLSVNVNTRTLFSHKFF